MLLTSWIQLPEGKGLKEGYQVIEFFAGTARVAKLGHAIGLVTTAHDIMYDETFKPKKGKKTHQSLAWTSMTQLVSCYLASLHVDFEGLEGCGFVLAVSRKPYPIQNL